MDGAGRQDPALGLIGSRLAIKARGFVFGLRCRRSCLLLEGSIGIAESMRDRPISGLSTARPNLR
jgi:hypothetical protein